MLKTGRLPRTYDPRFPHHGALKALLRSAQCERPVVPATFSNSSHLPRDVGMMLNDQIGDCAVAGFFHALQVWSQDANDLEITQPDDLVLETYQELGYLGGLGADYDAASDTGLVLQDVLARLLNVGVAMPDGSRHQIRACFEVDVTNHADVREVAYEFGAAYIGFRVPAGFMEDVDAGLTLWDVSPKYGGIEGGHCVIVPGAAVEAAVDYSYEVTSWGRRDFKMTRAFFDRYVDECYGIIDDTWIAYCNATPYGVSEATLEQFMSALRT